MCIFRQTHSRRRLFRISAHHRHQFKSRDTNLAFDLFIRCKRAFGFDDDDNDDVGGTQTLRITKRQEK